MDKEQRLAERAQELREQEEAIAETANKLADKMRELNLRAEDLDGREEALKRAEGFAEARRAQELAEARKEAEKPEKRREEANAITEQAEEEAKGIIARATAKASAMMARQSEMMAQSEEAVLKIPLVNKMLINWAEKQEPEEREQTEDVLDKVTQYGIKEPVQMVTESEDERGATARAWTC